MSSKVDSYLLAIEPNLKKEPRLNFQNFRLRVIGLASQMCNDITGPTGLLGFLFTAAEWAAIPGISVTDAAGVVHIEPVFDIVTPIVQPNAGAAAGTVKFYEIARTDRSEVKKGISILKSLLIDSLPSDDISELSDLIYGMMLVTCRAILTHAARKYGTLNQEDFETIHSQMQVPKSPTIDYSSYAEIQRNYHRLLLGAGQPCSEFAKTTHYMNGLKDDLQGREAVKIYVHLHPLVADRNFADLVAAVILHAPIHTPTSTSLGYSNALSTTTSVTSASAAPLDELALSQLIAKHQKDLSALRKKNGVSIPPIPPKVRPLLYCWLHGYQHSHNGTRCKIMEHDPKYTAAQKASLDPLKPPGGNTNVKD